MTSLEVRRAGEQTLVQHHYGIVMNTSGCEEDTGLPRLSSHSPIISYRVYTMRLLPDAGSPSLFEEI